MKSESRRSDESGGVIFLNVSIEILLIEDNEADAELTREAMAQHKILVNLHVVKTGEDGLQFLLRRGRFEGVVRPDLILLDLNLPGMDGREVLREIKSNRYLRHIPVVILTTSEADLDILRTYAMGANAYVVKPVDFENFSQIVAQIENFWFSVVKLPTHQLVEKYATAISMEGTLPFVQKDVIETLRVLHVEDSDADADLVSESLSHLSEPRFQWHRVNLLSDAFDYLETHTVDAVLLDLSLPDSHGFETLTKFLERTPNLPIVVLTGAEDKELGARSVREGAQDYLFKGQVECEILGRTIRYAIERKISVLAQAVALNEAQRAIGVRDEFLSIASHELRTPLTSLRLQISLLKKVLESFESKDLTITVQTLASKAEVQIDRFTQLVETLLDFSRIQSGRLTLEYSKFDLYEIVRESVDRLSLELKNAGCTVEMSPARPIIGIWDRFRIDQVVINLLSNAIKYARGKPIKVSLSSDGENAWIQVKDQGPGISSEDKERIFHKFERAPGLRSISGLGLGLYVVRQIVDMHAGTIHVESELGAGATFIVRLPMKPVESIPVLQPKAIGA